MAGHAVYALWGGTGRLGIRRAKSGRYFRRKGAKLPEVLQGCKAAIFTGDEYFLETKQEKLPVMLCATMVGNSGARCLGIPSRHYTSV